MNLLLLINYYCHTLSKYRSMAVRRDPRKGIKMSKEQITVLLVCSADGDKLKRLVIAKAENPLFLWHHQQGNSPSDLPRYQQSLDDDHPLLQRTAGAAKCTHETPETQHSAVCG